MMDVKAYAESLRKMADKLDGEEESPEFKEYRRLLTKLKSKDSIKKLKLFLDNPRVRKPLNWWLIRLDKSEGSGSVDLQDSLKKIKMMLQRDMPAARILKMLLDYGIQNGHVALDRLLSKDKAKMTLLRSE